jgi:anti-anti-sigma regulatory factor
MQLSVEVRNLTGNTVFVCHGQVVKGQASDYLLELITRPDRQDVILDMEAVSVIDDMGITAIILGHQLLSAAHRRLFLRNAPAALLDSLQRHALAMTTGSN